MKTVVQRGIAPQLEAGFGKLVGYLTRWLAIAGGMVLVALVILTVVSISGRAMIFAGLGPVPGDFELVEVGTAFAIFAFLPWCQYKRGHVTVDMLVDQLSSRKFAFSTLVGDLILTVVSVVIFWRLLLGTLDKQNYGETTFILQFPLWWGYANCLFGAGAFVLVSVYSVWRSLNELLTAGADEALERH